MSASSALTASLRVCGAAVLSTAVAAVVVAGSNGSAKGAVAVVLAAALVAGMLWFGLPSRRYLLALLFLTAPLDISKAVVAPLDNFVSPGLYVTIGEAVMLLLGLVFAGERLFVQRLRLPLTTLDAWSLGFLAFVWFGASHAQGGVLAYASALSYSLCVLGFYVVSHAVQTKEDVRLILLMVVAAFCFEAAYVALQMVTHAFWVLPGAKVAPVGTQGLNYEAEQLSVFRPIGSFDHPNALASYLTLLLPAALGLVLMTRRRLPPRVYGAAVLVAAGAVTMLLLSLSRGGWAAALLGIAVLGTVYWRRQLIGSGHLLALSAVALAGLIAVVSIFPQIILRLTEPDSRSTESRLVLTDQALTIISAHPLAGVGFGGYNRAALENIPPSFALISEDYQKQLLRLIVHDHYLLLAAELGLPAMLYFICLMWRLIRQAWPLTRWRDPGMFALGVGLAAALASQMLYLSSDNYYADIRVFLLWLTAGLLQAMTRIADGEHDAQTSVPTR